LYVRKCHLQEKEVEENQGELQGENLVVEKEGVVVGEKEVRENQGEFQGENLVVEKKGDVVGEGSRRKSRRKSDKGGGVSKTTSPPPLSKKDQIKAANEYQREEWNKYRLAMRMYMSAGGKDINTGEQLTMPKHPKYPPAGPGRNAWLRESMRSAGAIRLRPPSW